jgi:hypothetical protein
MRQSRFVAYAVVAVALFVGFILLSEHRRHDQAAIAAETSVTGSSPPKPASALETTRIVPADVLGTGVVYWAPLTGDGSN